MQADLPMSPGRAAAAIMRQISGMIGVALSPAICHHSLAELVVGASPFDGSLVESTISTDANEESTSITSSNNDEQVHSEETAEKNLQMMAEDNAEEGDGGDSDVEGDEVNMHYQAMTAIEENDLDLDVWGEVSDPSIPGAPEGWIPPSAPIGFIGYCKKIDAPSHFSEVDNPGRWSDFVFQPKYVKVKGRDKTTTSTYASHFTPAGVKVVPADSFGQCEGNGNGWKFFTVDGNQTSLIA